jgi:hypothetical protein
MPVETANVFHFTTEELIRMVSLTDLSVEERAERRREQKRSSRTRMQAAGGLQLQRSRLHGCARQRKLRSSDCAYVMLDRLYSVAYRRDVAKAKVVAKRIADKAWRKRSHAEIRFINKRLFFS